MMAMQIAAIPAGIRAGVFLSAVIRRSHKPVVAFKKKNLAEHRIDCHYSRTFRFA
jgi:hypothetical protein